MNYGGLLNPNRDWGANPARNQWVAGVTGYGGDFGGGSFGQWGQQNGWDAQTLANTYNAMNQGGSFYQPAAQAPQSSWASSPALNGLLAGLSSVPSYGGFNFGQPVGSFQGAQQPLSGFPTQGSNMLWTL